MTLTRKLISHKTQKLISHNIKMCEVTEFVSILFSLGFYLLNKNKPNKPIRKNSLNHENNIVYIRLHNPTLTSNPHALHMYFLNNF